MQQWEHQHTLFPRKNWNQIHQVKKLSDQQVDQADQQLYNKHMDGLAQLNQTWRQVANEARQNNMVLNDEHIVRLMKAQERLQQNQLAEAARVLKARALNTELETLRSKLNEKQTRTANSWSSQERSRLYNELLRNPMNTKNSNNNNNSTFNPNTLASLYDWRRDHNQQLADDYKSAYARSLQTVHQLQNIDNQLAQNIPIAEEVMSWNAHVAPMVDAMKTQKKTLEQDLQYHQLSLEKMNDGIHRLAEQSRSMENASQLLKDATERYQQFQTNEAARLLAQSSPSQQELKSAPTIVIQPTSPTPPSPNVSSTKPVPSTTITTTTTPATETKTPSTSQPENKSTDSNNDPLHMLNDELHKLGSQITPVPTPAQILQNPSDQKIRPPIFAVDPKTVYPALRTRLTTDPNVTHIIWILTSDPTSPNDNWFDKIQTWFLPVVQEIQCGEANQWASKTVNYSMLWLTRNNNDNITYQDVCDNQDRPACAAGPCEPTRGTTPCNSLGHQLTTLVHNRSMQSEENILIIMINKIYIIITAIPGAGTDEGNYDDRHEDDRRAIWANLQYTWSTFIRRQINGPIKMTEMPIRANSDIQSLDEARLASLGDVITRISSSLTGTD